jgi:hypothetical protein
VVEAREGQFFELCSFSPYFQISHTQVFLYTEKIKRKGNLVFTRAGKVWFGSTLSCESLLEVVGCHATNLEQRFQVFFRAF